jgi:hypothetical protein
MDRRYLKQLGTYKKIDRSAQYARSSNDELLRSLNSAWKTIRSDQRLMRIVIGAQMAAIAWLAIQLFSRVH